MNNLVSNRESERGSAGVKFVLVLVGLILVINAGINYVPVRYEAEGLKGDMETAVLQGIAMPGKINPVENVKVRIQKAIVANNIPPDAYLEVKQAGNAITARVAYNKDVNILPFGIYKYNYKFDQTVTPTGFLLKQ